MNVLSAKLAEKSEKETPGLRAPLRPGVRHQGAFSTRQGSGREFQFFGPHFTSKSRTDTRVGAFDRYTLSLRWKNMELVCRPFEFFLQDTKVEKSLNFRCIKWHNSEISDIKFLNCVI